MKISATNNYEDRNSPVVVYGPEGCGKTAWLK
jgi:ABC-type cobalamin/Fe3+-siderophores transport system ATPase subunit